MISLSRRKLLGAASLLGAVGRTATGLTFALPLGARARTNPDVLRIVCGYPAGSPPDFVSRQIGERLAGHYAKSVVVENRTGAAGRLAVETLKGSPADGSVMLLTPASVMTMYPYIYRQLTYSPLSDFAPVSLASDFSHALAVGPMVPASVRTAKEFAAWCAANSASATCGNPGAGSLPHFLAVLFERAGAANLRHVPYRGTGPAVLDVVGGQIASAMGPEGNFLPFVESGHIRVIALTDSKRSPFMPAVQTFTEQGYPSINLREWFGLFMPGGTPPDVVSVASSSVASALAQEGMAKAFAKMGMATAACNPAELAVKVRSEYDYWGPVIKPTGFSAES